MARDGEQFCDGFSDGLAPLVPLDLAAVTGFSDLLERMGKTAFGGRTLGEAADVLTEMFRDDDCFTVLTLSGAMTAAKQGKALAMLIESGCVDAVISTGAILCHGLIEELGGTHFKACSGMDDQEMHLRGYDRIYDTLELEQSIDASEAFVMEVLAARDSDEALSSREFCAMLGEALVQRGGKSAGLLSAAAEHSVPVFIPAMTDSELGLDLLMFNDMSKGKRLRMDPLIDLAEYTERVDRQKLLGIFTLGGGVPRNWAQQVGPYLDALARREDRDDEPPRFQYGVRICPEPVHWGGLSGCTYSEGVSWGKFIPCDEGGRFAEVYADATIALPILLLGVFERLGITGAAARSG